MQIIPGISAIW